MSLPFADRADAGRQLAAAVAGSLAPGGPPAVVLGIPRGGIVVAAAVAARLGVPLDVVVVRKLGAPGHAELALGAVGADGTIVLEAWASDYADAAYLKEEAERQAAAAREREERLRRTRPTAPLAGRTAILVDDGIATGATMAAALLAARARGAARVVVAAPVASPDAAAGLRGRADALVFLAVPGDFGAVGEAYREFDQTSDEAVAELLAAADGAPGGTGDDTAGAGGR